MVHSCLSPMHYTDRVLKESDFCDIYHILYDARVKWRIFGIIFGVKLTDLKDIEDRYKDNDRRLEEVIQRWLKDRSQTHTWGSLVMVLRDKLIDEGDLADKIEEKLKSDETQEDVTVGEMRVCVTLCS